MAKAPSTSSAPRPAPKPAPKPTAHRTTCGTTYQSQQHPQPAHCKNGATRGGWGGGGVSGKR